MPTIDIPTGPLELSEFLAPLSAAPDKFEQMEVEKVDEFSELRLSQLFKYNSLKLNKTVNTQFEKKCVRTIKTVPADTFFGIEVEVENIKDAVPITNYWLMKTDGSLRNNGNEFVSQPLRPDQVEIAVNHLKGCLYAFNTPDFSNRTSVHVHVNVRELTMEQVWCFTVLYAVFEKHFYKLAGTKRESSIFCVPLYKTNFLRNLENQLQKRRASWSKYCGLNLLPIYSNSITNSYGTVEFRHFYGTVDPQLIVPWINSISSLYIAAQSWTKASLIAELFSMNTTSSYEYLYNKIFGAECLSNMRKHDFESCVSYVKKELFGKDYMNKFTYSTQSVYAQVYQELFLTNEKKSIKANLFPPPPPAGNTPVEAVTAIPGLIAGLVIDDFPDEALSNEMNF